MEHDSSGEWDRLAPLVAMHVLVVSHELEWAHDRARSLEELGYRVTAWGDPARAANAVLEHEPETVLVDLGREVAFPADVTAQVRAVTRVPLIAVGCAGTHAEMVRVFEAGADEYCRPRCGAEEIDLRLRALWRRIRVGAPEVQQRHGRDVIHVGDLEIDPGAQTVRKKGELVSLSPTEYRLLLSLAEHQGEVVPSKALISRVWGNQYASESHYLRLYVRYLRQKLEDDPANPRYIVNRWGAGYALHSPTRAA